jgi:hypothetical protein
MHPTDDFNRAQRFWAELLGVDLGEVKTSSNLERPPR